VWTGPKQIERLTKPGSKYLNLNPYEVSERHLNNREVKFDDQYKFEYEQTKEIELCEYLEVQNVLPKTIFKG